MLKSEARKILGETAIFWQNPDASQDMKQRFWEHDFSKLEKEGFKPIREYSKDRQRADIGCNVSGELVAFEIGTSSARNEITNIKKDLKAGFDRVKAICTDAIYKDLQRRVKTELDAETRSKVEIELTYNFYNEKVRLPENRKVLLICDDGTSELQGRVTGITLKTLPLDNVKDQHISWADRIIAQNDSQKDRFAEMFPEVSVELLQIPKDATRDELETLLKR